MSSEDKTGKSDGVKDKASFYSRDPRPFSSDISDPDTKPYAGEERRKRNRRVQADRRGEVRFEPGKEDRRKSPGRRKGDKQPKFW